MARPVEDEPVLNIYEVKVDEVRSYPMVYKVEAESESDARDQVHAGNILDKWQDGGSEIMSVEIFDIELTEGGEAE